MNIGGIDLNNMLVALYPMEHESQKWTRRIFYWIISTAMTNAWQLYKTDSKMMLGTSAATTDLLRFSLQRPFSCVFSKATLLSRRLGRRSTDFSIEVAKDQTGHWPDITQTRR
ncbi:conserved hypothetical protein [Trichinella spiralis]|uniref:hypothetical protein n=1 Tax=Trichinella spiralis TaxID=6334 RepID=UPI0001EFD5A9|nr:conserved hypothetical protein [Trichinella spiralis]